MNTGKVFEWRKEGFVFEAVQIGRQAFLVRSQARDGTVATEMVLQELPAEARSVSGVRAETIRRTFYLLTQDNRIDTTPMSVRPGGRVL